MNALEEFRAMIEEHWPHFNPQWRENGVGFALEIDAIADRIEEENRILQAERDTAVQTATDQAGARRKLQDRIEAEYMELPRDKNGEIIHVGDIMRDRDGNEIAVDKVCSGGFFVGTRNGCFLIADGFTHVNPDTWERIEADAEQWYAADYWHAREKQTNNDVEMQRDMRIDLVRRCKSLAGADDE